LGQGFGRLAFAGIASDAIFKSNVCDPVTHTHRSRILIASILPLPQEDDSNRSDTLAHNRQPGQREKIGLVIAIAKHLRRPNREIINTSLTLLEHIVNDLLTRNHQIFVDLSRMARKSETAHDLHH
jgi:hypothetical protein